MELLQNSLIILDTIATAFIAYKVFLHHDKPKKKDRPLQQKKKDNLKCTEEVLSSHLDW